jgi:hypothetical protein
MNYVFAAASPKGSGENIQQGVACPRARCVTESAKKEYFQGVSGSPRCSTSSRPDFRYEHPNGCQGLGRKTLKK